MPSFKPSTSTFAALLLFFLYTVSVVLIPSASADLIMRDEDFIPRHTDDQIPFNNSTSAIQAPSIRARADVCPVGRNFCEGAGGCCTGLTKCCGSGCYGLDMHCCADGSACPTGKTCCGGGCVDSLATCCGATGSSCAIGRKCCGGVNKHCALVENSCCLDYGSCPSGYTCIRYKGIHGCCRDGRCGLEGGFVVISVSSGIYTTQSFGALGSTAAFSTEDTVAAVSTGTEAPASASAVPVSTTITPTTMTAASAATTEMAASTTVVGVVASSPSSTTASTSHVTALAGSANQVAASSIGLVGIVAFLAADWVAWLL